MNELKEKLRYIFLPYVFITIVSIVLYTSLRYLFDTHMELVHLKEDVKDFWIPFGLAALLVLLFLRKRIHVMNLDWKSDKGYTFYQMIAFFSIAASMIIAQMYVKEVGNKLISIIHIGDIEKHASGNCYSLKEINIDQQSGGVYPTSRTSGKNNQYLTFYIYFVAAIKDKDIAINGNSRQYWFGFRFTKQISNHGGDKEKNAAYEEFYNESVSKANKYDFHRFKYLKIVGYNDDRDGYLKAIESRTRKSGENNIVIVEPKDEAFENKADKMLAWSFGSFGIGAGVFFILLLFPSVNRLKLRDFIEDRPIRNDDLIPMLTVFIPKGQHVITALLLDSNLIVFISMVLGGLNAVSPTPLELLNIGAIRRYEVINGEWWRLVSSLFIHGGFMHLFMNIIGLGVTTFLLEAVLGKFRLVFAYIFSGIIGGLVSIYWHENTVSVGASGAILGMIGVMCALLLTKKYKQESGGIYLIIILLFGGITLLMGLLGGIDNAAHIGGLIGGFVIGLILSLTVSQPDQNFPRRWQS